MYGLLALMLILAYPAMLGTYWVPAFPGMDPNGYLLGGKMLARHGSMKLTPVRADTGQLDIHQHVGGMWVGADLGSSRERYYPKYPIGLPLLVAAALRLGGQTRGLEWAYAISPLCATLALAAVYLMMRMVVGSFLALLGMIVLASSPIMLGLATTPLSHASALCCVTWGMYLLLHWWQMGGARWATAAGLLLGYAGIIRYTEALLVLPLALVALFRASRAGKRGWLEAALLLAAWALPITALFCHNRFAMGTWTGYDASRESTGFGWSYAADNWETMLRQLGINGLVFVFPLGIAALPWMARWNWRFTAVLVSWIVPCLAVYTFYYYAPDSSILGYARFFLTVLPAVALCGFWWFLHANPQNQAAAEQRRLSPTATATAGLVSLISMAAHLHTGLPQMEVTHGRRLMLQDAVTRIKQAAPMGSVIICPQQDILHQLALEGDYYLYTGETFDRAYLAKLPRASEGEPDYLDLTRRQAILDRLGSLNNKQLKQEQRNLMLGAMQTGHRVFFVLPRRSASPRERAQEPLPSALRPAGAAPRPWPPAIAEFVEPAQTRQRPAFTAKIVDFWSMVCNKPYRSPGAPRTRRVDSRQRPVLTSAYQIIELRPGKKTDR